MHPHETPDQASGLRRLFGGSLPEFVPVVARRDVTAPIVANLGAACARIGRAVLIVDQTPGEIAAALGLAARRELAHVIAGERRMDQVLLGAEAGLAVLPATRGLEQVIAGATTLENVVEAVEPRCDLILVHAEPTQLAQLSMPCSAEVLLPISASATALTAAYIEVKRSVQRGNRVRTFVHGVATTEAAGALFASLADLTRKFLAADISYCGFVPSDPALYKAVAARRSVFNVDPASAAARALEQVAGLLGERRPQRVH